MSEPNAIRLIRLGRTEAVLTQALYHALAERMTPESPDTIILCNPASPYVCLGYHQLYDAVLDRAECERRTLPIVRRLVGGGATFLDSDQLFYQCVFHHSRVPADTHQLFALALQGPVQALRRLGLNAALTQVNEIEVNGQRIAGTGGGRIEEACVVVGNILFDFDYATMARLWQVPSESFRELALAAMRERVTTLRQLGVSVEMAKLENILAEEFTRAFQRPLQPGALSETERVAARQVGERLQSAEYLALHSSADLAFKPLKIAAGVYIHAAQAQVDGVSIRASFRVDENMIREARLESEPPREWGAIETRLRGIPLDEWQHYILPHVDPICD